MGERPTFVYALKFVELNKTKIFHPQKISPLLPTYENTEGDGLSQQKR